jgi:hypothetical protein
VREWLETLEATLADAPDDAFAVAVAYAAGRAVALDEREVAAALRRSVFVLAAGGDPHRHLHIDAPAVHTLAADIDDPSARGELLASLRGAAAHADALPRVSATITKLLNDPDVAWRTFACALLAEEVGGDG